MPGRFGWHCSDKMRSAGRVTGRVLHLPLIAASTTVQGGSMPFIVKRVEYFHVTAAGQAGAEGRLLSAFASAGVNLRAFKAVLLEPLCTRFTLVPDDGSKMV